MNRFLIKILKYQCFEFVLKSVVRKDVPVRVRSGVLYRN